MTLAAVWFFLIFVLIIGYAILDGFDLGVGSLFYVLGKTDDDKKTLINSIAPVWDGNEVWLLTGAGALFAAFPFVYATVFSGFYLAMMLVLFGLIFRVIGIEYYFKTDDDKKLQGLMGKMFFLGSFLPALLFGVALGNLIVGIPINELQNYTGSFFALLNPYALAFGILGLVSFLMQGAIYSIIKTDGNIQDRALNLAPKFAWANLALWVVVTALSVIMTPYMFDNFKNMPLLFIIPVLTIVSLVLIPTLLKKTKYGQAFIASSLVIASQILTFSVGMFPNLVFTKGAMDNMNIYNAASTDLTLKVMLIVALIGMPIVIAYTIYSYMTFRGKAKPERTGY